jgi:hypothetical protein
LDATIARRSDGSGDGIAIRSIVEWLLGCDDGIGEGPFEGNLLGLSEDLILGLEVGSLEGDLLGFVFCSILGLVEGSITD